MSEQYVHVVRFETREESGTISVHSTRKQGLVAALQTVAEHVEYDWSEFPVDLIQEFANLCGVDDEDSLYSALTLWNDRLCTARALFSDFRVYVSVEQVETEDAPLDVCLPAIS